MDEKNKGSNKDTEGTESVQVGHQKVSRLANIWNRSVGLYGVG